MPKILNQSELDVVVCDQTVTMLSNTVAVDLKPMMIVNAFACAAIVIAIAVMTSVVEQVYRTALSH